MSLAMVRQAEFLSLAAGRSLPPAAPQPEGRLDDMVCEDLYPEKWHYPNDAIGERELLALSSQRVSELYGTDVLKYKVALHELLMAQKIDDSMFDEEGKLTPAMRDAIWELL